MPEETQSSPYEKLAEGLPDNQKTEYFKTLHEVGISPEDVELARLLKALQLYKAYYESIPKAVTDSAGKIDQLKQEIEKLSVDARAGLDAGARLAGQVIKEAEKVSQGISGISVYIDNAMRQSAEGLTKHLSEQLTKGIKDSLTPLEGRLIQLVAANKTFDDAIAQSKNAAILLQQNAAIVKRSQLWTYGLCSLVIICSLVAVSWFWLHRSYEDQLATKYETLVKQNDRNRVILLRLSKLNRSLELHLDPDRSGHGFLILKGATGWQSATKQGVIEFGK
ncbi:MAG: hypothetical protein JXA73_11855 [Acidobacteria bacterium]|nr:hypothetical protein [Acidobacteriota bacterium]